MTTVCKKTLLKKVLKLLHWPPSSLKCQRFNLSCSSILNPVCWSQNEKKKTCKCLNTTGVITLLGHFTPTVDRMVELNSAFTVQCLHQISFIWTGENNSNKISFLEKNYCSCSLPKRAILTTLPYPEGIIQCGTA